MRKILLSLVAFGAVAGSAATQSATAQPMPLAWASSVQTVQYYEPGWREREDWHRREEWRRREEFRRRQEWREAHERRRGPPPPYGYRRD